MAKHKIGTIHQKNRIIDNIIRTIVEKDHFLICGHKTPDEDCIASMVAFAILLTKFDKTPMIYLGGSMPANLSYLLNICKYNSIRIINEKQAIRNAVDVIIICDTPKKTMLNINRKISAMFADKKIVKIEIDHHLGGDSDYIGDPEYSLVTDASSASELVGYIALKLRTRKELLNEYLISDPFSRNLVLAILTGIVGDTQMGKFLKSKREHHFYNIFSDMYNSILQRTTVKETNFTDIGQVFKELQHLSEDEERCYRFIYEKKQIADSIGYVLLRKGDMKKLSSLYDGETIITVTRAIADTLAEESGKLSLLCYYDQGHGLVQFRMRRSRAFKSFDLRDVLKIFEIPNGGGHEGAIGFRVEENKISDIDAYLNDFLVTMEKELAGFS
ncbi:MAG: hypothetical protein EPN93_19100 [Spirochaetes bacterium]|nr:MAG: hypothetical protein EPN93_19100 [Spirochaetota bacterium]